ncbi:2-hydroxyacid dehydrogenase [Paraflavitalea sp. CAU 1676]|uniref:2-hydroxyacid dehydrogenase n=1 Tax=Paraflavitalea sp. CAU 1676 TaxID=3032598 RepID=UPI0023DC39A7|nr:2-hydroxyacid dehydrogenase [Paraflavitalea sp. CAU 1676]MDF2191150.1 2-hydroxyacid dehydrogenase [Paraflavitalea sp. CAU 1676]
MKILITAPYHEQGIAELQESLGEVIYKPWKINNRAYNEEELLNLLYETEAEALITEHDHVTEKVIQANRHLRFIGVCRGTPSNVALKTATESNIPVFYTPARNAQAVAEMFIANVITFMRHTLPGIDWLKGRKWEAGAHTSYLQFKGNELAGKTIGLVGFGAIGQLIAKLVAPYPCNIQYYDPFVDAATFPAYKKTSLEEVFASSDIVSIHLPVTPDTQRLIDVSLFALMKADALFVNTARAVVVDREALYAALSANKIKGAILDVFDNEPPDELDYSIIDLPNVLATPHIAGATFEVEDHHVRILNEALINWFVKGKKVADKIYNKEVITAKV